MGTHIHTKKYSDVFNGVTIPSAQASQDISADEAEVTTSVDDEKKFLQGKYGWTRSRSGPADFADGGGIETLFTNVTGGGAQTGTLVPDGDSAVGPTNPEFEGSEFCTSLGLTLDQGGAAQFSSSFRGTGALARNEA